MAAGDIHFTNNFKEMLLTKQIDLVNDVIKVALYSDAYASAQLDGAAPAYSTTNEISAANYTAGGATLGSKAVTQDDTNDRAAWDAADVTWNNLGAATIQRAVIYDDTTTPKHIIAIVEISTNANGGPYTLAFNANGILLLS